MINSVTISCVRCRAEAKYADYKELYQLRWTIIGWSVNDNKAIVYCPKCLAAPPPPSPRAKKKAIVQSQLTDVEELERFL